MVVVVTTAMFNVVFIELSGFRIRAESRDRADLSVQMCHGNASGVGGLPSPRWKEIGAHEDSGDDHCPFFASCP